MTPLADLLSSRVKAELFRLLFNSRVQRLHLRELERQSGLALGTVRQELARLTRLELVLVQANGNRTYYFANKAHPLYQDIRNIVIKTCPNSESAAPVKAAFASIVPDAVAPEPEDAPEEDWHYGIPTTLL